jgi:hypothetical protein
MNLLLDQLFVISECKQTLFPTLSLRVLFVYILLEKVQLFAFSSVAQIPFQDKIRDFTSDTAFFRLSLIHFRPRVIGLRLTISDNLKTVQVTVTQEKFNSFIGVVVQIYWLQ